MSAYWDARAAARDKVYDRAADRAVLVTKRAVENALRTLKTEMADILRVFAKRFDLTRDEAQTLLAAYADEETQLALQRKIAQLVQTGDGNALRMLKAQVDAKAYAARLSRAQAMHDAIVVESVKVAQVEQEACRTALQDVYIQGNSRMMFDIQKDAGRMFGWTAPSVSQAMETLRQRWAGGNYAARIWQNAEKLALDLESAVMENVLSGKTSESTYQALLEAAEGHMPTVNRLIRTETVYVANQAEKDAYEEAGIDQYRYVARLEAHTCERCGKLDGEVFPVYKGRTGTNLPPMHPWCRCTTEPADDVSKMLRGKGKRWSTDPVTGEDVYVPDDMTYAQWKAKQKALQEAAERAKIEEENRRQEEVRKLILSDATVKAVNLEKQARHILGAGYVSGRSYIYGGTQEAQALVDQYHGTGEAKFTRGEWKRKEVVTAERVIGVVVSKDGKQEETNRFVIHYSKTGVHIVPTSKE